MLLLTVVVTAICILGFVMVEWLLIIIGSVVVPLVALTEAVVSSLSAWFRRD